LACFAVSCGNTKPLATDGGDVTPDAGNPAPDAGAPDAHGDAVYYGVVQAKVAMNATTTDYSAYADFVTGQPFGLSGCMENWPSSGDCCCLRGIPTPLPIQPPDAADMTLTGPGGGVLATLVGGSTSTDGSLTLQGTDDLGVWWYVSPGGYPRADSQPWSPGDVLQVRAAGGAVAPFAGALRTGALLDGITPALGGAPLVIVRGQVFSVAWTPDTGRDATVLLIMRQIATTSVTTCFCEAPDSAGSLAVGTDLLGFYETDQLSGDIQLERLVVTSVRGPNANVDLIGAAAVAGQVTFR
jgi:hypothetical protein